MTVADAALTTAPRRAFRAIVFDWDGTAVAGRQEDAAELGAVITGLLRAGVRIVVVTGTNFGHVERQLIGHIPPAWRAGMLVCTNRGSEVYGFGRDGAPARRWFRQSTPAEEAALTAIAEGLRDSLVAATGLDVGIVYDRLNRRKVDLIPVAEWADPPKARFGELLCAVENRLRAGGLEGGLAAAIGLARGLAGRHGLPAARITSDIKHIEIGLTDKGDAMAWVRRELLTPAGIPPEAVLVAGDEFGPVAGFAGSDDRLRQEAPGAVVVSVGAEPNGVPPGVLHIPGGPRRFRELLAEQAGLHAGRGQAVPAASWDSPGDPGWRLDDENYEPAMEHELESRFAVGNGFLGVRGSMELPTSASRPRTYVAGLFEPRTTSPAVPALVPAPDWLRLRLLSGGEPLSIERGEVLAHSRSLDLERGVLVSRWRHRDPAGSVLRLDTMRFASFARRNIGVQVARIEVEQPGAFTLEASLPTLDGALTPVEAAPGRSVWQTPGGQRLAVASATTLRIGGHRAAPAVEGDRLQWTADIVPGQTAELTRIAAFARDGASAPANASAALRSARRLGPRRLLREHARAWRRRWDASDIVIEGDDEAQAALRFAIYHLNSAANPEGERSSIGARALTGDGYLGHVFWDTEIFLVPFYVFTWPEAARAMLMYRYHTLPAARAKAARLGYRGALYAWESADTGEETTPPFALGPEGEVIPIRAGVEEHHISADIAYAVWRYWEATGDTPFLTGAGAEIVLETARFWCSRARVEDDGRAHIRGVIGPDEYHEGVDDNAYTNVMARWNLRRGVETAQLMARRWPQRWAALREQLSLSSDEVSQWAGVAERMATGLDAATGLFEQFAGFHDFEPIDLSQYEPRAAPMDVILGRERAQGAKVIKQADVVMLLALLWDDWTPEEREANFRYYEPLCAHGSSLSPAVHARVAARLGEAGLASRFFHDAATIDLDDTLGNAAAGVHIAAMGGLWQAAVFGFGGITALPDRLRFDPHLPEGWEALRFPLRWRGRTLRFEIEAGGAASVTLQRGRPMRLEAGGVAHRLASGHTLGVRRDATGGWVEAQS